MISDGGRRVTVEVARFLETYPRRSDQYYVWWTMEGPRHLRFGKNMTLKEYDGLFNLTMTYRRDADIYSPYDHISNILWFVQKDGTGNATKDLDELIMMKTNISVWIVSNCKGKKGAITRWQYVLELRKAGLDVDGRGGCFPESDPIPHGDNKNTENFIKRYKFYIAFENNLYCKDYITEKLFRSLRAGTVPVVMGPNKTDYEAILPTHSFIHVDDFESPAKLASYLQYLDKNITAYTEYLWWRKSKMKNLPQSSRKYALCQLCRILHGINIDNVYNTQYEQLYTHIPLFGYSKKQRIVKSIREWYYGTEYRACLEDY
ncbi:4-galactosyl-N-acetylglucosaminide 3-alpha-L-fucosyltransferase FUT6-like [Clavelina lepadiformis]|uniref:4-galactosyl-N-acetylglucosaminide 3-alpha-L-fucosyltransferase FUT6-like n=1 Tax=Clavelina lepadiformis TaxID=159417 RepID=UPI004042620B